MRVYLHTFGCKANQYDTEVVRQALEDAGAVTVADPGDADAAVVNSCTVTHTGEARMRSLVRRLARERPQVRTVVMGCAAALDDGKIAGLPRVERVVPGADARSVLGALGLPTRQGATGLRSFARGSRAWIRIQDGCDEHCTFCATTAARGANRSRSPEEIADEAEALAEQHDEVVLTGIHIGTYGRDLTPATTLGELCERLVTGLPHTRFRLSSVEATEVDDLLAELMISEPRRLAPHLHAPLQSGSDRLLRRMGRHWYTAGSYRRRIEWLCERIPRFGLGADVIVGFPGESDEDHRATVRLIEALPFTYLHVFPYSQRPDAPARRLGPPVSPEIARARSGELRQMARRKGLAYRSDRSGSVADLVPTGRRHGRCEALTEDYLAVYLESHDGPPSRFDAAVEFSGGELVVPQTAPRKAMIG